MRAWLHKRWRRLRCRRACDATLVRKWRQRLGTMAARRPSQSGDAPSSSFPRKRESRGLRRAIALGPRFRGDDGATGLQPIAKRSRGPPRDGARR
jgi:hypothetical protein